MAMLIDHIKNTNLNLQYVNTTYKNYLLICTKFELVVCFTTY